MKPNSPQPAKSQLSVTRILTQTGRLLFLFFGLISCFITIFMIMTGNYTKIFDATMVVNCTSASLSSTKNAYNYLVKINTLEKLVVILDLTSLCLFALAIGLSIARVCRKQSSRRVFTVLLALKSILSYMLLLSAGTLFGNIVKTLISLNEVYSCSSNQANVEHFFSNSQTLALLTGISLLSALINLLMPPFRLNKSYEKYQIQILPNFPHSQTNFMLLNEEKKQIKVLKNDESQTEPPKIQSQPQKKSQHKPRIFGRQFLTETRYGHHSRPGGQSPRIYEVSADLLPNQQDIFINLDLEQQKKITPRYKTSNLIQSHLVKVPQGPPLQLGEFITPLNAQELKLMPLSENAKNINKKSEK